MRRLLHHNYALLGGFLVLTALLLSFLAPVVTQHDPTAINPRLRLEKPSSAHLLGTDEFGRDIFSRVLYGARTSMMIGFSVVFLTTLTGIGVGLYTGFYPGADRIIMRIIDGWMAFPEIIVAITLAAIWGSGIGVIILAISFAYFPRMCRVVRGTVLTIKEQGYIEAARATGNTDRRLLLRHILPNCLSHILVQATFSFAAAILAEAALSFIGVGIQPPAPSLGGMVSQGRNFMPIAPWIVLAPGLWIMIIVLGLNILGDGFRDIFDPRTRKL